MSVFFLQVSRCEKFGYGLMVTQVAATAPGVAALHKSGTETFIRANTFQHYAGAQKQPGKQGRTYHSWHRAAQEATSFSNKWMKKEQDLTRDVN